MGEVESVKLRGEGGVEWEVELPLSELYAEKVQARKLIPVNEDEHAKVAYLLDQTAADGTAPVEETGDVEDAVNVDELRKLKLADLVEYAGTVGVDADTVASFATPGTTKAQVIDAIVAKVGQA